LRGGERKTLGTLQFTERRRFMIGRRTAVRNVAVAAALLAACVLVGCAAKTPHWGDPETGLILEYQMPEGRELSYEMSNSFTQHLEIPGQTIENVSKQVTGVRVTSRGVKDGEYQLTLTLDSASLEIGTPQGDMKPDVSNIIGKSIEMALTSLGEEKDLPDANSIQIDLGAMGGKRSAITGLEMLFADTPGRPVTVGDTWTSSDGFTDENEATTISIMIESVNTLVGFETVDGYDCAKIAAVFTGVFEGEGQQGPMVWTSTADVEGTGTWYFAYKKGILVKDTALSTATGTIEGQGEQVISIPMKQDMVLETKLVS
jgi:hypothetical protein